MDMSEFLSVFLAEASEQIEQLEEGFLRLEQEPGNQELLQNVFRAAHTLKGSAGMMGYAAMAGLTHHLEDVLGQLRDGQLSPDVAVVDALLLALDQLKVLRDAAAEGAEPDEGAVAVVVDALRAVASGARGEPEGVPPQNDASPTATAVASDEAPRSLPTTRRLSVRVRLADECAMPSARAFMVLRELDALGRVVESKPSRRDIEGGKAGHDLACVVETDAGEDALREAVERVFEVAEVEVSPAPAGGTTGGREELLQRLNEAALLVVQAEPGDPASIGVLREHLAAAARSGSVPPALASILSEAVVQLDAAASADAETAGRLLAEVGRILDRAMLMIEEADGDAWGGGSEGQAAESAFDVRQLAAFVEAVQGPMARAEELVLALQAKPDDAPSVRELLATCQVVKELAEEHGFAPSAELAARAQTFLEGMLERSAPCRGGYADLILRCFDMLKLLVGAAQDVVGGEPFVEPQGLGELITALEDPGAVGISPDEDEATPESLRLGDILVAQHKANREDVDAIALDQGSEPIGVAIVRSGAASLTDVGQALRTQQKLKGGDGAGESYVRVRTDRLDRLIDTIGELVIAQSMVAQDETVLSSGAHELARKVAHTSKIVRELQDLSMAMRMVPLKAAFQKMARVVRDVAQKAGKQARLVTEGEETEIDRNMVEVVNDPLLHLVRNAVDHGIEPPEERERAGKPPVGTVTLSAYHSGGNVVIEVSDDGRGLDRDAIVRKALSHGLVGSDRGLTDAEVFGLVFQAGFSTAKQVTDISGRGVGLDVVKAHVEALRGRVTVESQPGQGSIFRMFLPLTMAITDGMLVRVGDQRYIIPTVNIHMSLRPEANDLFTVTGRGEMLRLRDELIPVFRLHRVFQVPGAVEDPLRGLLVVVDDGNGRCALLVDELLGQQQVVAKSLGEGLGKVPGVSGGAILGDGRVGLIVDTQGVAALARRSAVADEVAVVS